jgi:hypothetical protein
MAIDAQSLPELLEAPSERLDLELKGWLDLDDNGHKGTLAKGLIALANHGGGAVIIGFDTNGNAAPNRPATLAAYDQDSVNDIVDRYAEPGFHCTVRIVRRVADGLDYPVILVPGGHKVPVRSKRGSPGNEIIADRYYIRRPGPASEMPQTGHEWDELIRRCIRSSTDDIAALFRDVLEGRAPKVDAPPNTADRLARWDAESLARWQQLLHGLPANSPVRMPHGHYRVAAVVENINVDIPRLREVMHAADRQRLTGWPPWWWPTRDGIAPYVQGNTIECHIAERQAHADPAHSDFWRVATNGELFLVRGYIEDSLEQDRQRRVPPGTVLDLTLPVWRIGECLLFIQRFATEAGAGESTVSVRCEWTGLQGRTLTVLSGNRLLMDGHRSRSGGHTAAITVRAERISAALPEIVRDLVKPLYALFDFFEPPATMYGEEIGRMLRREF